MTNRTTLLTCMMMGLLVTSAAVRAQDAPQFRDLFNGKDLSGWVNVNTAPDTWKVEDGILTCTGQPIGVMRTDRQYENFILQIDWKHLAAGGNSGVFVWSDAIPPEGKQLPKGVEVQMLELEWATQHNQTDAYVHGEVFGVGGLKTVPDNPRGERSKSAENRCKGKGQWNTYTVVCVDGTIKLAVNGKFVNGISKATVKKGYICLESEGAPIHFRNIRIMELPPGITTPEQTAPVIEVRERIESAIPAKAPATPRKKRRLLIYDGNVGYGGHGSIPTANLAFTLMGEKTGAFETTVSRDPEVFRPVSLKQFDAVFFNNTVGNLFTDPALRQSLVEFVYAGGGLMGVHGTSVAFTQWPGAIEDWPEFGLMIGARGANHRANDEHVVIKLDDPAHPVNQVFGGQGFDYRDEFFRVHEPYSRDRVRVLLSIDTAKTDLNQGPAYGKLERADNDFALAWVRNYGRGRAFYCTIAHNPYVFWDAKMLQFYLAATQFALGDLPAPTIPSARLTPAIQAQEKLGWRLGIEAYTFHKYTLFEAIEKTAELGLPYMGGLSFQKVSKDIAKDFDDKLTDDELRQIRLKLDSAGVRMLTYYYQQIPGDEAGCRQMFEFGRKIGIETFMSEPLPEALDTIEKFADEYDICVAIHNHDQKGSPQYWHPREVLKVCQGRSKRIGACGDFGYWMRSGIDPIEAVRTLKDRLITVQMHDLDNRGPEGHDVPWGTGIGQVEQVLREMHSLGIIPVMFGLEYSYNWLESMPEIARSIEFFNKISLQLAK